MILCFLTKWIVNKDEPYLLKQRKQRWSCISRDPRPACLTLFWRKKSGWWVRPFSDEFIGIFIGSGYLSAVHRWARLLTTCFVWALGHQLPLQLKSEEEKWTSYALLVLLYPVKNYQTIKQVKLVSGSPPPGGIISNPLTGLCLAVASDVSLIFKLSLKILILWSY